MVRRIVRDSSDEDEEEEDERRSRPHRKRIRTWDESDQDEEAVHQCTTQTTPAAVAQAQPGWSCTRCTLINADESSKICNLCGARRTSIRNQRRNLSFRAAPHTEIAVKKKQGRPHVSSTRNKNKSESLSSSFNQEASYLVREERAIGDWLQNVSKGKSKQTSSAVVQKGQRMQKTKMKNTVIDLADDSEESYGGYVSSDDDFMGEAFKIRSSKERNSDTKNASCKSKKKDLKKRMKRIKQLGVKELDTQLQQTTNKPHKSSGQLWVNKHKPLSVEALSSVISKPKVLELKNWLQNALNTNVFSAPRLLILHGSSGIGKSTALQVLAHLQDVQIREWESERVQAMRNHSDEYEGYDRSSLGNVENITSSQLKDFAQFTRQVRYTPLQLSSMPSRHTLRQLLLVETLPHLRNTPAKTKFQEMLFKLAQLLASDELVRSRMRQASGNTHTLHGSKTAIAILYTCESETSNPRELSDTFSDRLLDHPQVTVLGLKKITDTRLRRRVKEICQLEGSSVSDTQLGELVSSASGDLRHAIHSAQFFGIRRASQPNRFCSNELNPVKLRPSKNPTSRGDDKKTTLHTRDANLSLNHAVGRILYAKRIQSGAENGAKPKLEHVPEVVVDNCPLSPDAVMSFVHHNMPNFFQDLGDMEAALETLSVADSFMGAAARLSSVNGRLLRSNFNLRAAQQETQAGIFPQGYVSSLSSWTPAVYNRHTIQGKFRPITKPEGFGIRLRQEEVKSRMKDFVASIADGNLRIGFDLQKQVLDKSLLTVIAEQFRNTERNASTTHYSGKDTDIEP